MTATENDGYFEAYWPRAARQIRIDLLARRLDTLAGKKIAFLWDFLFRGDQIFTLRRRNWPRVFPESVLSTGVNSAISMAARNARSWRRCRSG